MGLIKKRSVFLLNERFFLESRFWDGNPLYEGSLLGPDCMGKLWSFQCPASASCSSE